MKNIIFYALPRRKRAENAPKTLRKARPEQKKNDKTVRAESRELISCALAPSLSMISLTIDKLPFKLRLTNP